MAFNYAKLLGRIKEFGFLQEEIAEKIGISPGTLSAKLNNKSSFTDKEIVCVAEILCIPQDEISLYFFCQQSLEKLN